MKKPVVFAKSKEEVICMTRGGFKISLTKSALGQLKKVKKLFEESRGRKLSLEEAYLANIFGLKAVLGS